VIFICSALTGLSAQFGEFTYIEYDTTVEITRYPRYAMGDVTIPSEIVGKPVTSTGAWAFSGCELLTSVTIGDNVTSIGEWTFPWCRRLTDLTIGAGVTSIGEEAFSGCPSLKAITVNEANSAYSSVDGVLFGMSGTALLKVPEGRDGAYTIPDGVISIGEHAFGSCTGLTSVTITDGVTNIGDWAFAHCSSLTSVTIPESVTSIGKGAFLGCGRLTAFTVESGNPAYSSVDGVLFD